MAVWMCRLMFSRGLPFSSMAASQDVNVNVVAVDSPVVYSLSASVSLKWGLSSCPTKYLSNCSSSSILVVPILCRTVPSPEWRQILHSRTWMDVDYNKLNSYATRYSTIIFFRRCSHLLTEGTRVLADCAMMRLGAPTALVGLEVYSL